MARGQHLQKNLLALTTWTGKREDETYAQTKLRLQQAKAFYAAFDQAAKAGHCPNEFWKISKEDVVWAFVVDSGRTENPRKYIYESYGELLQKFCRNGWADVEASRDVLVKYGTFSRQMRFCREFPLEEHRSRLEQTAREEIQRISSSIHPAKNQADYINWEHVYLARKDFPHLVSDEFIREHANVNWLLSDKRYKWELDKPRAKLIRTLPEYREMAVVAKVNNS